MAFLEQFSEDERNLIVSLPYKAGLWVSTIDDAGGTAADYKELEALERIISEKGKGMFESAFVHEVMAETCTRQQDWKAWADGADKVLVECTNAVKIIADRLAEKDIDAYRQNIMSIAVEVAKAFREFDADAPLGVRLWTQYRLFLEAIFRIIKRDKTYESESMLNISYEEDMALSKLSKALYEGAVDDSPAVPPPAFQGNA